MKLNELFYHEALRKLNIGTTIDEFAEAYANSSKEAKNNSIWQSLFEEGKEIFRKNLDVVSANDTIDAEEYNLFSYVLNFIKKVPFMEKENYTPEYKGETDSPVTLGAQNSYFDLVNDNIQGLEHETFHLKSLNIMKREEKIAELKTYFPDEEFDSLSDDEIMERISAARTSLILYDKGSDDIDYHIGTFFQGNHGSCGLLSQIAQLSDDDLHKIIEKGEDEKGTYYDVTFPMHYGHPEESVRLYEEDVKADIFRLGEGDNETEIHGFSMGDNTVRLLEMAYAKKFGTKILEGNSMGEVQNVFTFPDTPMVQEPDSEITEEKLLAANNGRATLCVKYISAEHEDVSFLDTCTDESGLTATYGVGGSLEKFKATFKARFPQVDENLYKDLAENEFLEFVMLFENTGSIDLSAMETMSPKERVAYMKEHSAFTFQQRVEMSNGEHLINEHAYIFRSYDPETKILTVSDTHKPNEDMLLPLEIAKKFFLISN